MLVLSLEIFWACCKTGALAFGGGNTAIPLLQAEAVPRWVTEQEFGELVGLNFAFPGVSIVKLAGMLGMRVAGIPGLLAAIVGITAPGLLITVAAAALVQQNRNQVYLQRALLAMRYGAVGLLAAAVVKLVPTGGDTHQIIVGMGIAAALFGLALWLS